ncbi:phage portal protein [Thalassobius sp. I31.1]|uniref:phage portal protein n=1 Tax=Thalassobius sp. I31.1 TaxID=2109912 RepID=UPI000D1B5782|nr:phage portal protein [Thalassobius sp. I31.1]
MWGFLSRKSSVDARILDAIDEGVSGGFSQMRITPEKALGVVAVFAAVRVISEDVAKLPAKLLLRTDTGDEVAHDAPEHLVLSRLGKPANEYDDGFTSMEWIEAIIASAALHGTGVVHLNRVGGRVREVTPIPHGAWRCDKNKWTVKFQNGQFEKVSREDLMVLRGPQLGLNVTQVARQSIELARRLDAMMLSLARKAGRANGIISSEGLNSKERASTFVSRIKQYFGPSGDGGIMPLDLGALHYVRLSMTPEELQQDATYSRVITQVAGAYRVQPARLMHALTEHNNASLYASNRTHVEDCVQPWSRRFRLTFDKDVLGTGLIKDGYLCDVALQGLLQGDPEARGKLYMALRTVGAVSPLTVAKFENLPTDKVSDDPAFALLTNPNPKAEKDAGNADE